MNGCAVATSTNDEFLDSISRTLAQVIRLAGSRATFAQQAGAAGVLLTQPGYALLRALIDDGPLPMSALARATQMDTGMVTRQVSALVNARMVTREPDPTDGRIARAVVTNIGREVAAALQSARRRHLQRSLYRWTLAELNEFDRLLRRFVEDTVATPIDER
ncbi:MarR family transcriptional regulator [Mycolicibacterium litorale]|nr:MarR family transcriptional regulator [Mycolicibacterium litorale]